MADQRDLPSDSDDSDVDFKPSDEESLPSEEESDGCVEEDPLQNVDDLPNSNGKRKKKQTKRRKKIKKSDTANCADEVNEKPEEVKKLTKEEEKLKMDSLWNDFLKDTSLPVKKSSAQDSSSPDKKTSEPVLEKEVSAHPIKSSKPEEEIKTVTTEVYDFAGEKVKVEKEVPAYCTSRGRGALPSGRGRGGVRGGGRGGGGLAALVGQLGKKNKLSTLEKSKLDWDAFKKTEGIDEELQTHNKGKEGYLERQDFLQRTDLRQFEIEKQLRSTSSR